MWHWIERIGQLFSKEQRARIQNHMKFQSTQRIIPILKNLARASESPKGFAAIAAIGLVFLLLLNIPSSDYPAGDTPETAISELSVPENKIPEPTPTAGFGIPESADALTGTEIETVEDTNLDMENYTLKRNETLTGLLQRAKISTANANQAIVQLRKVANLRKLQSGQTVQLRRLSDKPDTIAELRLRDAFSEEAAVTHAESGYIASRQPITTYGLTRYAEGEITDSLYLSAKRAGVPDKVIIDLIRLLTFDVDFEREIWEGDRFQIYFERTFAPQFGDVEDGRILSAVLTMRSRTAEAYYYKDTQGEDGYYDSKGQSTRRALMKTPLDVAVVTSSYGSRKHPVLGYTRMHKGVDFRAPTGTPIMAAGHGTVEVAGKNGSYGNYVRIRHNSTYQTAYAHLSKFGRGIKKGARVSQGQIIGYAGATGRVTAAHLHYEVMMRGSQVNPLTLKLPSGRTLEKQELAAFHVIRASTLAEIEQIRTATLAVKNGGAHQTAALTGASEAAR